MTDTPATGHRPPASARQPAAWALAGAAAALPFLSALPIDVDRLAPLAALPAVWLGWKTVPAAAANSNARAIDRWLLTATVTVALLSAAWSAHPVPALVHTAALAWILAATLLARKLATEADSMRVILGGISVGAALGCLAVWIGWKEGTPINAFPHYGHGRLFGLHQMIGTMAALAWLSATPPKTIERHAITLIAVIACDGMLWSGGRAPLVGAAVGIAAGWVAAGPGRRGPLALQAGLVFAGGLVLSLARWSPEPYLGWWGAIARSAAATSVDELSSTRLSFWQVTWHEFLKSPWIGHGADAYRFLQPKQDGSQPHNWPLQLLVDFGVVGAGSLGTLFVRQAWRGLKPAGATEEADARSLRCAIAGAFVACLTAGVLDGIFYHAVLFVPAALLAGMSGGAVPSGTGAAPHGRSAIARAAGVAALGGATALLAVHSVVVGAFIVGSPPVSPDAPAARLLRVFPSATFGITGWLNRWRSRNPEDAIAWAKWAQRHSDNPAELHVYAAVLQANLGNLAAAAAEVDDALLICHVRTRPKLLELQQAIAGAQAERRAAEKK